VIGCKILSVQHASLRPGPLWIFPCWYRYLLRSAPISPTAQLLQGFRSPSAPAESGGLQPITQSPLAVHSLLTADRLDSAPRARPGSGRARRSSGRNVFRDWSLTAPIYNYADVFLGPREFPPLATLKSARWTQTYAEGVVHHSPGLPRLFCGYPGRRRMTLTAWGSQEKATPGCVARHLRCTPTVRAVADRESSRKSLVGVLTIGIAETKAPPGRYL
jgi:hypothetical protein